jgi:hypothetical protein
MLPLFFFFVPLVLMNFTILLWGGFVLVSNISKFVRIQWGGYFIICLGILSFLVVSFGNYEAYNIYFMALVTVVALSGIFWPQVALISLEAAVFYSVWDRTALLSIALMASIASILTKILPKAICNSFYWIYLHLTLNTLLKLLGIL